MFPMLVLNDVNSDWDKEYCHYLSYIVRQRYCLVIHLRAVILGVPVPLFVSKVYGDLHSKISYSGSYFPKIIGTQNLTSLTQFQFGPICCHCCSTRQAGIYALANYDQ